MRGLLLLSLALVAASASAMLVGGKQSSDTQDPHNKQAADFAIAALNAQDSTLRGQLGSSVASGKHFRRTTCNQICMHASLTYACQL